MVSFHFSGDLDLRSASGPEFHALGFAQDDKSLSILRHLLDEPALASGNFTLTFEFAASQPRRGGGGLGGSVYAQPFEKLRSAFSLPYGPVPSPLSITFGKSAPRRLESISVSHVVFKSYVLQFWRGQCAGSRPSSPGRNGGRTSNRWTRACFYHQPSRHDH